ncbi:hypothetical protein GH733_001795 [Mirounga leonina]|nr:hypothetical protein GH733_001795 [Mirounga leonina]
MKSPDSFISHWSYRCEDDEGAAGKKPLQEEKQAHVDQMIVILMYGSEVNDCSSMAGKPRASLIFTTNAFFSKLYSKEKKRVPSFSCFSSERRLSRVLKTTAQSSGDLRLEREEAKREVHSPSHTEKKAAGKEDVPTKRLPVLRAGDFPVTTLVENKKAQLVMIVHDVDLIELVVFLPALCHKMGVPYCIIKGEDQAGIYGPQEDLHHCCLTQVNSEEKGALAKLVECIGTNYNDRQSCAYMYVGIEDGGIKGRRGHSTPDVFYKLPFDLYKEALRSTPLRLFSITSEQVDEKQSLQKEWLCEVKRSPAMSVEKTTGPQHAELLTPALTTPVSRPQASHWLFPGSKVPSIPCSSLNSRSVLYGHVPLELPKTLNGNDAVTAICQKINELLELYQGKGGYPGHPSMLSPGNFLVTFPQVTSTSGPNLLLLVLAAHLEGEEGLERGRSRRPGEPEGFGRRELTQEAGPCAGGAPPGGLKRGRKWAPIRMRPEGLRTTCPLTAALWKRSPERGLPAECTFRFQGVARMDKPTLAASSPHFLKYIPHSLNSLRFGVQVKGVIDSKFYIPRFQETAMTWNITNSVVDGMRNCSRFLIKKNKQTYSTKPNNLKAPDSFHYSGLIHSKTVGMELVAPAKIWNDSKPERTTWYSEANYHPSQARKAVEAYCPLIIEMTVKKCYSHSKIHSQSILSQVEVQIALDRKFPKGQTLIRAHTLLTGSTISEEALHIHLLTHPENILSCSGSADYKGASSYAMEKASIFCE